MTDKHTRRRVHVVGSHVVKSHLELLCVHVTQCDGSDAGLLSSLIDFLPMLISASQKEDVTAEHSMESANHIYTERHKQTDIQSRYQSDCLYVCVCLA